MTQEQIDQTVGHVEQTMTATARHDAASNSWPAPTVEFFTLTTFGFVLLTLSLCTVLLWKRESDPLQILRLFGIIVIICMSALLLFVGYDEGQLTPIVGLFGAIAGYLLGKDNSSSGGKPAGSG